MSKELTVKQRRRERKQRRRRPMPRRRDRSLAAEPLVLAPVGGGERECERRRHQQLRADLKAKLKLEKALAWPIEGIV